MRTPTVVLALALLAACAPREEAPPAAAPTIADFAGTWQVTTMIGSKPDTVLSVLSGTADASSWTLTLPNRPPNKLTVSIVGDSLVTQSPEYESILRKGVMVSTRTAVVKTATGLAGNTTASYRTATGTEIVLGTLTATKAP